MRTTGGSACDVLVVGAGVAGLSAAVELDAAGVDVLVVEARERTGGRLRSVSGATGQALDLGATWFWPHERLVRDQVARLGLGVFAQHTSGDALVEAPDGGHDLPGIRRIGGNPIDVAAFRFT